MNKLWAFLFLHFLFISSSAFANEAVGKISYLRGNAFSNNQKIKLNQDVFVNDKIKTEDKSVVKIKLIDMSTIIVAPNSTVNIEEINSETKASLISVLKGSLRAVVPKKINKDKVNKLVIKSPIAAFGVRGTDFLVGHSKVNSHIITFSGKVKVASLKNINRDLDGVNRLLDKNGIVITKGEFSSIKSGMNSFTAPVRINKSQFFALRRNKNFSFKKSKAKSINRKIYPKNYPKTKTQSLKKPPESNAGILPGGFVELKSGNYVEPDPETSEYDSVNKMYVPSKKQGIIDQNSGEYIPSENYERTPEGELKLKKGTKLKEIKNNYENNKVKNKAKEKGRDALPPPIQQGSPTPSNLFQNQQQNNNQDFSLPPSTKVRVRIRNGE